MTPEVVGLVLLSALIHAVWSFYIKGSQDPLAFNLIQGICLSAILLVMLFLVDWSAFTWRIGWLLMATGVAHALYLYGLSLAFAGGDLSLVYPIARSTPAFLPLFAIPLTGERLTVLGGVGIAIVVAGMWAVQLGGSKSDSTEERNAPLAQRLTRPHLLYAYLALVSSIAYGLIDKLLMQDLVAEPLSGPIPPSVFCFFALWLPCMVFYTPLAMRKIEPGSLGRTLRLEWRRATLAGSISIAGYSLILKAFETAPASYVVAVRQSSIIFVLALSVALLRERPEPLRVMGAIATFAGVVLIAVAG